jgi:methionyl-tRNA formyltransferase
MPEIGTFNLHGSLLPQYRGAAPINWAIMNGEKETGVTTFFLKHEIDTGSIIFQEKETIEEDDNVGSVYERLMARGAGLVLKTVKAIQTGDYPQIVQDESVEMKHAPKIFKETCEIDWTKSSEEIYNFIRGLSPYPAAWASIGDRVFKIFGAKKTEFKTMSGAPGEYETDNKTYLLIQTGGSPIAITELQMQGKKRMDIESFLRGTKL